MSVTLYVAETARQAREEAEASTMGFFRSISKALKKSDGRRRRPRRARRGPPGIGQSQRRVEK